MPSIPAHVHIVRVVDGAGITLTENLHCRGLRVNAWQAMRLDLRLRFSIQSSKSPQEVVFLSTKYQDLLMAAEKHVIVH